MQLTNNHAEVWREAVQTFAIIPPSERDETTINFLYDSVVPLSESWPDGLREFLVDRDYTGDETPDSLAAEWDKTS